MADLDAAGKGASKDAICRKSLFKRLDSCDPIYSKNEIFALASHMLVNCEAPSADVVEFLKLCQCNDVPVTESMTQLLLPLV